jgi:hypothetical protein
MRVTAKFGTTHEISTNRAHCIKSHVHHLTNCSTHHNKTQHLVTFSNFAIVCAFFEHQLTGIIFSNVRSTDNGTNGRSVDGTTFTN